MLKSLEMAFRGSSFQNFSGEDPLDLPSYIAPSGLVSPPPPPTFNSFLSLCITNFIVQIIVLNGPSKPENTNSVSQNFKNLEEDIPELRHFRVCPPPPFRTGCRPCPWLSLAICLLAIIHTKI